MTDDQLLEQFFREAREVKVPDNGFTERVMEQIPDGRTLKLSRLWTAFCVAVAAVFFVVMHGWEMICYGLMMLMNNLPAMRDSLMILVLSLGVFTLLAVVELLSRERSHAF